MSPSTSPPTSSMLPRIGAVIALLLSTLTLTSAPSAFAQFNALQNLGLNAPANDHPAQVALLAEPSAIAPGQTFTVALSFTLEPTWHVYWTNPGGPGFAPSIRWELPEGFSAGAIQWPAPHHFEAAGITQYGYEDQAYFLVDITAPNDLATGQDVTLTAHARWLVCQEACIPGSDSVSITLPTQSASTNNQALVETFAQARAELPEPSTQPVEVSAQDGVLLVTATGLTLTEGAQAHLYPQANDVFDSAAEQVIESNGTSLTIRVPLGENFDPVNHERFQGVINFKTTNEGDTPAPVLIDAAWSDTAAQATGPSNAASTRIPLGKLLSQIGFAFLGGIILNLMPCVFPVLSLKIMGFVQQAGEDTRLVKVHGLVFGAGVLISFWVLAGLLLGLRAGGDNLGWGFQLSSPNFVLAMLFLIFGLGLSLAGVFEIGTGMTRLAGNVDGKPDGYGKSFFSGVLATAIATPCTGPFMGAALGVALAAPAYQAMLIFTGLAVGMATPYVLLSFFPKALSYLPKPGPWMETFKQAMAFPMFATAAWLMWVYVDLKDTDIIMPLGLGLTLFALGGWAYGRYTRPHLSNQAQWFGRIAGVACLIFAVALIVNRRESQVDWEPFTEAALAERRQENRPVLIDFTATWCLSCQANKKTSLRTASADELFLENNVAVMEADWTDQSERILKVLQAHGRSGVPLYLVYPKDPNAEPKILPEILTPDIVRNAIEWAVGEDT